MPSPLDLVTLGQAQAYLGAAATGNDVKLGQLITACSMAILAATNRASFLPKSFSEVRDGNPRGIMLRNWPVLSVESVLVGAPGTSLPASIGGAYGYTLDDPDDPPAGSPQMLSAVGCGFPRGDRNVAINYTAGYQVTAEPAIVPAGGGTVPVLAPYGAWGCDRGVSYASGAALQAVPPGHEARSAYSVAAGAYTFAPADAAAAVLVSYGFFPADLANACLEWIADRLAYQDRIGLASKSIGGQETVSYRIGATPDFVKAMVANYTNVVPIF